MKTKKDVEVDKLIRACMDLPAVGGNVTEMEDRVRSARSSGLVTASQADELLEILNGFKSGGFTLYDAINGAYRFN